MKAHVKLVVTEYRYIEEKNKEGASTGAYIGIFNGYQTDKDRDGNKDFRPVTLFIKLTAGNQQKLEEVQAVIEDPNNVNENGNPRGAFVEMFSVNNVANKYNEFKKNDGTDGSRWVTNVTTNYIRIVEGN